MQGWAGRFGGGARSTSHGPRYNDSRHKFGHDQQARYGHGPPAHHHQAGAPHGGHHQGDPTGDHHHADHGHEQTQPGDPLGHEFTIRRGGRTVATVSKRWFSMRDTYAVDIAADQDDPLLLASVLALDLAEG
jgi:hypothetical protein